jgi:hypothetical protein
MLSATAAPNSGVAKSATEEAGKVFNAMRNLVYSRERRHHIAGDHRDFPSRMECSSEIGLKFGPGCKVEGAEVFPASQTLRSPRLAWLRNFHDSCPSVASPAPRKADSTSLGFL